MKNMSGVKHNSGLEFFYNIDTWWSGMMRLTRPETKEPKQAKLALKYNFPKRYFRLNGVHK